MDQPRPELTTLGKIYFWRPYVSVAVLTIVCIWILVWPPENLMIPLVVSVVCVAERIAVYFVARLIPLVKLVKPPDPNPDTPSESN